MCDAVVVVAVEGELVFLHKTCACYAVMRVKRSLGAQSFDDFYIKEQRNK